jgi:hypothetical protein
VSARPPRQGDVRLLDFRIAKNLQAHLYSDLMIYHMGIGLADNVTQGLAQGDMFRTTPLWGIGQRIFFLHDGRTNNLLDAIKAHISDQQDDQAKNGGQNSGTRVNRYPPSEATAVIRKFSVLSPKDQQAILEGSTSYIGFFCGLCDNCSDRVFTWMGEVMGSKFCSSKCCRGWFAPSWRTYYSLDVPLTPARLPCPQPTTGMEVTDCVGPLPKSDIIAPGAQSQH